VKFILLKPDFNQVNLILSLTLFDRIASNHNQIINDELCNTLKCIIIKAIKWFYLQNSNFPCQISTNWRWYIIDNKRVVNLYIVGLAFKDMLLLIHSFLNYINASANS